MDIEIVPVQTVAAGRDSDLGERFRRGLREAWQPLRGESEREPAPQLDEHKSSLRIVSNGSSARLDPICFAGMTNRDLILKLEVV